MLSNLMDGLAIVLIVSAMSCFLAPALIWVLSDRTHPTQQS
jgi:hypothetical protein